MYFDPNTDFTDMEFTEQELSVAVIESSTIGSIEGGSRVAFRCFIQGIGLLKGSYLLRSLISKRKSARICCQTVPWFQRQLRMKSQAWSLHIAYRFLLLESISGRSPENDLYSSNHLEKWIEKLSFNDAVIFWYKEEFYSVERMIQPFAKYSSNGNFVNINGVSRIANAFSHFTYIYSSGVDLVCDIQDKGKFLFESNMQSSANNIRIQS